MTDRDIMNTIIIAMTIAISYCASLMVLVKN